MAKLIEKWEQHEYAPKKPSTIMNAGEFIGYDLTTFGDSTTQFDITNPAGTTFRYTYDGTGTDPVINATTFPIGNAVSITAQNFATANKGTFVITGSGANYFEVTNAAGVAENNKTIGTGAITQSSGVKPITATTKILGVILQDVAASDPDYTAKTMVCYQVAPLNLFQMAVTVGAAAANMIGLTFNIDSANAAGLNVTAVGTQFIVRKVLSTTLVEVEPVLV